MKLDTYHMDSSEDFIRAVKQISNLPLDNNALNFILNNADENDALTLWHLLNIPDIEKRKLVLTKLDEILLMEITEETNNGMSLSEEVNKYLLDFIKSDLLIRSNGY